MSDSVRSAYQVLDDCRVYLGLEPRPYSGTRATIRDVVERYSPTEIQTLTADGHGHERVRLDTAAMLRRGGDLSDALKPFVASILEGKKPPKKDKRPDHLLGFVIAQAVLAARDYSNSTYRNEVSEHQDSALDAVVEAAAQLGLEWTYEQVRHRYRGAIKRNPELAK